MPSLAAHLHCTKLILFAATSHNPVGNSMKEIDVHQVQSDFREISLPKICLLGATSLKCRGLGLPITQLAHSKVLAWVFTGSRALQ